MIRFEDVSKAYAGSIAVHNLEMTIAERQLCVLVGPSGSGKSTLLKMINRMIEPSGGSVFLDGRSVRSFRAEELRRGIGYVIQSVGLFPHMSVAENIAVVPKLLRWRRNRIEERVGEMLSLVGLNPEVYAARAPHQLSGGEAQRVGVARALAADPPVLLMDEPFSAVDPIARLRLQDEFLNIQKKLKKTIVFVTHDVDEAIRLADRIALLKDGRLVQYDSPEALLDRPANAFVAGFVGSDRALKRLSRFQVGAYSRPAKSALWDGNTVVCSGDERFQWVSDSAGTLVGSVDRERKDGGSEMLSRIGRNEGMTLSRETSLKEALSAMIGSGARTLPVVDADFRLVGEISLADIESASERIS